MCFPRSIARKLVVRPQFREPCRRGLHHKADLLDELKRRGMVSQLTDESATTRRLEDRCTVYLGIDPTAKSLHVGHLLPLMSLLHFHLRGHDVIPVIGGATGLVGDPSGKMEERTPLEERKAEENVQHLITSVGRFFRSAVAYGSSRNHTPADVAREPIVANNVEWLGSLSLMDFLKEAGRHARVPTMIARDSVQIRMKSKQGISFTEFTYQLLQAYDFLHLYTHRGCTIQIGGSDQWGNILAGVDLIDRSRKGCGPAALGITTPLLTTSSGQKFGKSEGNAVWLDEQLMSALDLYQFFVRTTDSDVERYLKMFTLLSLEEIAQVLEQHAQSPEKRTAQRTLADEVVELIHGKTAVRRARIGTKLLYETNFSDLTKTDIVDALAGDARLVHCEQGDILDQPIWKLAATHRLLRSGSEARRVAEARGLYLNNTAADVQRKLQPSDLIDNGIVILRAGSHIYTVLAVR